jgi:uncharacterized protein DUF4136
MLMQRVGLRFCVGILVGALAAGCYPGGLETVSQTDLVATFFQKGVDFTAKNTYNMPDSIVDVGVAAGASSTLDHKYDAQILAKIRSGLQAMGYTRVTTTKPDVVVIVSAIKVDNYSAWVGYPWWPYWGWWGGWDAYWPCCSAASSPSWYYPWSPVVVTGYTSGSLFINMIDPAAVTPEPNQALSIWAAAINGMLEGTDAEILARINTNIDQAFAQSPYLRTQ